MKKKIGTRRPHGVVHGHPLHLLTWHPEKGFLEQILLIIGFSRSFQWIQMEIEDLAIKRARVQLLKNPEICHSLGSPGN